MDNPLSPLPGPAQAFPQQDPRDLVTLLSRKLIGQSAATKAIIPYVYMHQSGLAIEGRPAGIFLLLGPSGTGKTKTVEAIAEILHGSAKKVVKIDCGEFQMEHETAKLIGAPPGYLGHRETVPMLTQQQLLENASENCDLTLVLFDEIEKAAHSLTKLLLGILDKATLRLGDNTSVNFEKCLIFFTSNLGAREMLKELNPELGFLTNKFKSRTELSNRLENIALGAVRKRFSPEFVNRIDAVVTYQPLDKDSLETILDHNVRELQDHVNSRLGEQCFAIDVSPAARTFLLERGISEEYGARELKRTIHRELTQPLATMVARGEISPGAHCTVTVNGEGAGLVITPDRTSERPHSKQTILIVDDNRDLVMFLAAELSEEGWNVVTAGTAQQAWSLFASTNPGVALIDYMLGDDDGLKLALALSVQSPATPVILMTGAGLSHEEIDLCQENDLPILFKPFIGAELLTLIKARHARKTFASGAA